MTEIERQILKNQRALMTVIQRLPGFSGNSWVEPEIDRTDALLWQEVKDRKGIK